MAKLECKCGGRIWLEDGVCEICGACHQTLLEDEPMSFVSFVGNFKSADTGERVDVYADKNGLLTI